MSPQPSVPWVQSILDALSAPQYPALSFDAGTTQIIICVLWEDGLGGDEDGWGRMKPRFPPSATLQQQPTPGAATYTSGAAASCRFQGYWRKESLGIPNWREGDD